MKEDLLKLIELQKIDSKIYETSLQLKSIPKELETLKEKELNIMVTFNQLKEKIKSTELEKKKLELDIEAAKDKIGKMNTQLFQIKNNDEYRKMLRQIDETKRDIPKLEETLLVKMDDLDKLNEKIKESEKTLNQEKESIKTKQAELQKNKDTIEKQIKDFEAAKLDKRRGITPAIIAKYDQILNKRKDCAITPIKKDGTCGSCHIILLPRIIDDVICNRGIMYCDTCSRILYDETTLGLSVDE